MTCVLIVAFTGFGGKVVGLPEPILRQSLDLPGAEVRVLSDARRLLYLRGSAGHADVEALHRDLREVMARTDRTIFIGGSAGGYGALRHGLALGADAVIGFSAFTRFDAACEAHDPRGRKMVPHLWAAEPRDEARNMATLFADAPSRPRVMLHFSRRHRPDRFQAESLAGLPDVWLRALPGASHGLDGADPRRFRRLFLSAVRRLGLAAALPASLRAPDCALDVGVPSG